MGNQIRAARALLGWTRRDLARAAKLHPNAVAYWERRERIPCGGYQPPVGCRRMQESLIAAGVSFLTLPVVGVRLVATHNFCTCTRKRARAGHGVIEPSPPARSQNSTKTLASPPHLAPLRQRCGAETRAGSPCQRKALANGRCRNHGGMSSGPKSPAGRQRISEAQKERWTRWRKSRPSTASVTASSEG